MSRPRPSSQRSRRPRAAAPAPSSAPRAEPADAARIARSAAVVALVALVPGLWAGWRAFWFLTDDAHIAFRYVAQAVLGHGYVWNPAPFAPVEGYTSFLFVALLEVVWRLTGMTPPECANGILLLCAYATLALGLRIGLALRLPPRLVPWRLPLLALALVATVTNRTFLAWTSSGLETALFNALVTAWIAAHFVTSQGSRRWLLALSSTAALAALTRPDGLLLVAATVAIFAAVFARRGRLPRRDLVAMTPLLAVVAHVAWRRAFYGQWLPNTYYAKVAAPWPAAGARYLLSFVLEYAVWAWIALAVAVAVRHRAALREPARIVAALREAAARRGSLGAVTVPATLAAYTAYYVLVVGGDHFEYRVLSVLVLPLWLSFVWLLGRLDASPRAAAAALVAAALASYPVPWTHWSLTHALASRDDTYLLTARVAPHFPALLRPYAEAFDELQSWLILRYVCVRHQEHAVFHRSLERDLANVRAPGPAADPLPVAIVRAPGVASWKLPTVNVLDPFGLNDAVVAHTPLRSRVQRYLAHDREAPPGYLECFRANVFLTRRGALVQPRAVPLTAAEVRRCETAAWPVPPDPPRAPARREGAWTLLPDELPASPTRDGIDRAQRLAAQVFGHWERAEMLRVPGVELLPAGTAVQVVERRWLGGRTRVRVRGREGSWWVFAEGVDGSAQ